VMPASGTATTRRCLRRRADDEARRGVSVSGRRVDLSHGTRGEAGLLCPLRAVGVPNSEQEEDRQDSAVGQGLREVLLHPPDEVDDTQRGNQVDQAMETLPTGGA